MVTTAFDGVAAEKRKLPNNEFVCQRNGLQLRLVGNQITPPLEYGDLVRFAKLVLSFQQKYLMPGIGLNYLDGRRIRGQGHVYMLFAGNSTVSGVVEE